MTGQPLAPAEFIGYQDVRNRPRIPLFTLTSDVPGHPKDSTVAGATLTALGYRLPGLPEPRTERVSFRLFRMPCCAALLCWVNPRLPNFCPECGAKTLVPLRTNGNYTMVRDDEAVLTIRVPAGLLGP